MKRYVFSAIAVAVLSAGGASWGQTAESELNNTIAPSGGSSASDSSATTPQIAPPTDDAANASPVLAPVRANQSMTVNALLGFINSEPVYVSQVLADKTVDDQLRAFAKSSKDLTEFKDAARPVVRNQISNYEAEVLVLSAAKAALGPDMQKKLDVYINIERSKLLAEYGGSQAMAEQALKATGESVESRMSAKRKDLTKRIYLEREVLPKIVVTRPMVVDYYQQHLADFSHPAEIEMFVIELPITRWLREPDKDGQRGDVIANPTPAQISQAENLAMARANELEEELRKGADFAELAESNSVDRQAKKFGGRWPSVRRGSMRNEKMENYAFSLPANTMGAPLMMKDSDITQESVMIIRIGEKKEAHVVPFSEAQAEIVMKLRNKMYVELSNACMEKLKSEASVEAVDRMTDIVLDTVVTRYATQ